MANNGSVQFIVRARLTSEAVAYSLPMSQGLRVADHFPLRETGAIVIQTRQRKMEGR
jgi:hypothetical protein